MSIPLYPEILQVGSYTKEVKDRKKSLLHNKISLKYFFVCGRKELEMKSVLTDWGMVKQSIVDESRRVFLCYNKQ